MVSGTSISFCAAFKQSLKENLPFFLPVLLFIVPGWSMYLFFDKAEIHLFLNEWHHPVADPFFRVLTRLGGGWLIVPVALITLFAGFRYTVLLMSSYGLSIGIVKLIKHVVMPHMARPVKFFEEKAASLHTVEGVDMHSFHSFPSGHTTEIFSVITFIACVMPRKKPGFVLALIAILGGYSRIYLAQHFLMDVATSAFLSSFMVLVFYSCFEKQGCLDGYSWMHKSLLN